MSNTMPTEAPSERDIEAIIEKLGDLRHEIQKVIEDKKVGHFS